MIWCNLHVHMNSYRHTWMIVDCGFVVFVFQIILHLIAIAWHPSQKSACFVSYPNWIEASQKHAHHSITIIPSGWTSVLNSVLAWCLNFVISNNFSVSEFKNNTIAVQNHHQNGQMNCIHYCHFCSSLHLCATTDLLGNWKLVPESVESFTFIIHFFCFLWIPVKWDGNDFCMCFFFFDTTDNRQSYHFGYLTCFTLFLRIYLDFLSNSVNDSHHTIVVYSAHLTHI